MRKNFRKLVGAAVVVCGGWLLAGCVTRPVVNGVPNFAEVAPGIYRGGQPNEQGWQFLHSLGVSNIVKLNREEVDWPVQGMSVYLIPLPPATIWEVFQQPSSNDVQRAVQVMTLGGTFVHCEHGRDRAGLVVGCYRLWIDGWSEDASAREMSTMGYRWSIPGLTAFWKSVSSNSRSGFTP